MNSCGSGAWPWAAIWSKCQFPICHILCADARSYVQQQRHLETVSSIFAMRQSTLLRLCVTKGCALTIVSAISGIIQRVARLPVVSSWCSWRGAHPLLVVTLELIHDCCVARCYATTTRRVWSDNAERSRDVYGQLSRNFLCDAQSSFVNML